eukprot:TRINITY_DN37931_c0_g1_i1.p1 TRINITY_DN37931_c0_g1~~TRINITY_DN37931_c0_g1_i1.p1  ORF type:complete len:712 (+),score=113.93 TRINITY_DN37931_c0_g1_i1:97-2232(+)
MQVRPLGISLLHVDFFVLLLALLGHLAVPADVRDRAFAYKSYKETNRYFEDLQQKHSDIVEVWYAQDIYPQIQPDKKSWGTCEGEPCKTIIVRIANKKLLTNSTPEVFFSGALHGDERVGPLSVTELAAFLCDQYRAGHQEVMRLVDLRATWIMPMTNAWGYANNRRDENGMDPNRDFPYLQMPTKCMQTQTGRAVNELFRQHLFQYMITFHGGMRALTYEWGSKNHMVSRKSTEAPDNAAFAEVGRAIRDAAGKDLRQRWWYPLGPINDLVYPVDGGMEDWSYGAGWEASPRPITVCTPRSYGGYAADRTKYRKNSISTLVYLAEMDDFKTPRASTLGHSANIWRLGSTQGHVPRNLRMCLKIIELARPEIVVHSSVVVRSQPLVPVTTVEVVVHGLGCQQIDRLQLLAVQKQADSRCDLALTGGAEVDDVGHARVLREAVVIATENNQRCRGLSIWQSLGEAEGLIRLKGALPHSVHREFCLLVAAEFDAHWGLQSHPDPSLRPRAHATRSRIDDHYSVQASDGQMRINSHRVKLFPVQTEPFLIAEPAKAMPAAATTSPSMPAQDSAELLEHKEPTAAEAELGPTAAPDSSATLVAQMNKGEPEVAREGTEKKEEKATKEEAVSPQGAEVALLEAADGKSHVSVIAEAGPVLLILVALAVATIVGQPLRRCLGYEEVGNWQSEDAQCESELAGLSTAAAAKIGRDLEE